MAGHSKWNNIKRRKESQDAKKAKIFTKLSKEIYAAVRSGGEDPTTNLRLRMALTKARAENIPSDNIERTIKKAAGNSENIQYEEITYEGYGPGGVAVMVKALTDNRNRTAAEIRHAFSRNGGNLGENGCVSFLFDRKGQLIIERNEEMDEDEVMLDAAEAGAEEIESEEDIYLIETETEDFEDVKNNLEQKGYLFTKAEVTMIPQTTTNLSNEDAETLIQLIEKLEDNDDVQYVYHNFEMTEEQLHQFVN
ncbi:YebC/PmpR family DNA-binding transcriptional regulator [Alteribacillus iranensis]|uniref:Probable transcriptional regulatory protein SAMN05192532_10152 n=1 Tax=Alteribacillus iranensis TaxID=930128 RepID=A0A1I1Z5P8_9BACI|nr:YebC/PmpR family DNA-binding transcriptional regulator [Alteribacillus iranensis]SFE27029.1 DNA-binding regulatory protein, YebC/PmpR family [Alteribacillus iranensis]